MVLRRSGVFVNFNCWKASVTFVAMQALCQSVEAEQSRPIGLLSNYKGLHDALSM